MKLLLIVLVFMLIVGFDARTAKDDFEQLERGSGRILLASVLGNIDMVKQGVNEGGNIHSILEPFLAYVLLQKSPDHMYLPACPPIHLALFMGRKEHLNTATHLLRIGANINQYELPRGAVPESNFSNPQQSVRDTQYINRIAPDGFPPALLYAFGFGYPPTSSHAELILRLYRTLPEKFNVSLLEQYRNHTGNPPLLHITALNGFMDGSDLIVNHKMYFSSHSTPIDEPDGEGTTALHIAAWFNYIELMVLLLHGGADVTVADRFGRTPLHYAAMRGHSTAASLLLDSVMVGVKGAGDVKGARERQRRLAAHQDFAGRDALALAALSPPLLSVLNVLTEQFPALDLPLPPLTTTFHQLVDLCTPVDEDGDWSLECGGEARTDMACLAPIGLDGGSSVNSCWRPSRVSYVSATELTSDLFMRDFFTAQRPVRVLSPLTQGSAVWAHWEREQFQARYGAIQLRSLQDHSAEEWALTKPMRLLQSHSGGSVSLGSYTASSMGKARDAAPVPGPAMHSPVASVDAPHLKLVDLLPPPIFRLCAASRPYSVEKENNLYPYSMALGPAGSWVPLHASNASWSLLLFGTVSHDLVAPGDILAAEEVLYNMTTEGIDGEDKVRVTSSLDWLRVVAPVLRARGLAHSVVQKAGEVLFVPHNWLQVSRFHSDACLIQQEVCSAHNTIHRYQPLGGMIYGGEDRYRALGGGPNNFRELTKLQLSKVIKRQKRSKFPVFEMPPVT